jgi:hypothetical protein
VSDADLRSSDSERWLSCFRWTVSRQPFSQRNRILIIRAPFVPFQSTRPPRGQFPQRPRFSQPKQSARTRPHAKLHTRNHEYAKRVRPDAVSSVVSIASNGTELIARCVIRTQRPHPAQFFRSYVPTAAHARAHARKR